MRRCFRFALFYGIAFGIFIHGSAPALFALGEQEWRQYTYDADGFSIKLPYPPKPHPDSNNPNLTDYTIRLPHDELVIVRTVRDTRPCSATLAAITRMATEKQFHVRYSVTQGYKTVEEQHQKAAEQIFERYICTGQRYYILSVYWKGSGSKSPEAKLILESFRITSNQVQ